MKKQARRLTLSAETLRNLATTQLHRAVGGLPPESANTECPLQCSESRVIDGCSGGCGLTTDPSECKCW